MPLPRSVVTLLLAVCAASAALAQSAPPAARPVPPPPNRAPAAESGVRWKELTPAQQTALKPLERDWSGIESAHKQKWVELSGQITKMPPPERERIQTRMTEWAKLTPIERGRARLNFEEAKQAAPQDRQARWAAYQQLAPEQKRELAERAATARRAPPAENARADSRDLPQTKSNIVPNPAYAAPPRPITPTVQQAGPGATTTLISKRPAPPPHQQTGMPKIAATPGFVNKSTLLPQRGPQGAAAARAPAQAQPADPAPNRR
jgi:hypothetical protein